GREGEPTRGGVRIGDIFSGVYAVVGVLAALVERQKTGRGTLVDAALVDSQVGVLANQALNFLISGVVPKRQGNTHPNIVPYQVFPVADGPINNATGNESQYQNLCAVLGEPGLAKKAEYLNNPGRLAHRDELVGRLSTLTRRMKSADLLDKLEAVGVPAGPINDLDQVFADPQVVHRGMRLELASAAAKDGKIPGVRTPIMIGGKPVASPRPSPRLGEHTAEIPREIGEAWDGRGPSALGLLANAALGSFRQNAALVSFCQKRAMHSPLVPAKAGTQEPRTMSFYAYILASRRNGTLYTGMTDDLVRRVWQHRTGAVSGFTSEYGVKTLVWYEQHETRESALTRERQIKNWNRAWKLKLIEQMNPSWRDLWDDISV